MTSSALGEVGGGRNPCIVPRLNSRGVPAFHPAIYLPVIGISVEVEGVLATTKQIKRVVREEITDNSSSKPSNILRTPQLIHYIELRKNFWQAGQVRSLLTIALAVACIAIFPYSIVAGVVGGIAAVVSFLTYLGFRVAIRAHEEVMADLKGKTTFDDAVLKKLGIRA